MDYTFIGRVSISMCSNLCSIFDLYIKWLSLPQVFPTIFKMEIGICSNRISFRKRTAEQECNSLPFFHPSAVIWIKKFMWTSTYNFLTTFLRFLILNIGIKSENVVVDKCTMYLDSLSFGKVKKFFYAIKQNFQCDVLY